MLTIKKRLLNGNLVELGLYGPTEEITWELNRLYNSKTLEEPIEIDKEDNYIAIVVPREKWIRGKIFSRLLSWPQEKLDQFKGKAGGAWRIVALEVLAEIEAMPREDHPISLDGLREMSYIDA